MWSKVGPFYRECLRRAFRGVFWQIEKWAGGLGLIAVIFTRFVNPPEWVANLINVDLPVYFFLLAFAFTVLVGLVTAPVLMYSEQVEERLKLEDARKPKLNIYLKDSNLQSMALSGSTSETLGGVMQTAIMHFADGFVGFSCENIGETTVIRCRARLMTAQRIEPGGVQHNLLIVEAIPLRWTVNPTAGKDDFVADIPPSDTRRLWIANIRERGHVRLYRSPNELPVEHQQLLGPPGKYRILVQIDGDNLPPQQILLEVEGKEGAKPETGGVWKGAGSVSILAQGSPRLSHPSIAVEKLPRTRPG